MYNRPAATQSEQQQQHDSHLLSLLKEHSSKHSLAANETSVFTMMLRSQPRLTGDARQLLSLMPITLGEDARCMPSLLTLALQRDHEIGQQQQQLIHKVQARFPMEPNLSNDFGGSDFLHRLLAQNFNARAFIQQQQPQSQSQQTVQDYRPLTRVTTSDGTSTTSKRTSERRRDDALLHKLGSTLPRRSDPFVDVSKIEGPVPTDEAFRRNKGGVAETFPEKLHRMLTQLEERSSSSHIVSFLPHGRAFVIHDTEKFATELMPQFFCGQGKWSSFARQLRLYGFLRIHAGPDTGAYYHTLFLRGRPELCSCMRRVGAPRGHWQRKQSELSDGKGSSSVASVASSSAPSTDVPSKPSTQAPTVKEGGAPNFYAMDPL